MPSHHLEVCASVDLLNGLLWAGRNGLPPTPDTLHLGCSYHLHSSHRFLSTWGVIMKKNPWKKIWDPAGIRIQILNIIIHEHFLLLSVTNIKPLSFHHQPWSWLLGLLGGLATCHDWKVANFNQGSTSVQP